MPPRNRFFGGPGSTRLNPEEGSKSRFAIAQGDLGQRLGRTLQFSNIDERLGQAEDLLNRKGAIDPRIADAERLDIERDRQVAQQTADQTLAQRGQSGLSPADALKQQIELGAQGRQVSAARKRAVDQASRERSDLSRIFGDLFVDPSIGIITGDTRFGAQGGGLSDFEKFAQVAGQTIGALNKGGAFGKEDDD